MATGTFTYVSDSGTASSGGTWSKSTTGVEHYTLIDEGAPSDSSTTWVSGPSNTNGAWLSLAMQPSFYGLSGTAGAIQFSSWWYWNHSGPSGPADSIDYNSTLIRTSGAGPTAGSSIASFGPWDAPIPTANTWRAWEDQTGTTFGSYTALENWPQTVYIYIQQGYTQNGCADAVNELVVSALYATVAYTASVPTAAMTSNMTWNNSIVVPQLDWLIQPKAANLDYAATLAGSSGGHTTPTEFWPMEESGGATAFAWYSGTNDGTIVGGPTLNSSGPPLRWDNVAGSEMKAFDLGRNNTGGVRVTVPAMTEASTATSAFFSGWVTRHGAQSATSTGSSFDIIIGSQNYGLWYDQISTSSGAFGYNTWNNDIFGVSAAHKDPGNTQQGVFADDQWTHVAGVYVNGDRSACKLWLNGVSQTMAQQRNGANGATAVSGGWYFGAGAGPAHGWDGKISAVAVWYDESGIASGDFTADHVHHLFASPTSLAYGATAVTSGTPTWALSADFGPWNFNIVTPQPVATYRIQTDFGPWNFGIATDLTYIAALASDMPWTWTIGTDITRGVSLTSTAGPWNFDVATSLDIARALNTAMTWDFALATDLARGVALASTFGPWNFGIVTPQPSRTATFDSAMAWNFDIVSAISRGVALDSTLGPWNFDIGSTVARGVALQTDVPENIDIATSLDRGVALSNDLGITFTIATDLARGVALAADMPWNVDITTDLTRIAELVSDAGPWNFDIATNLSTTGGLVDLGTLDMPWTFDIVTALTRIRELASANDWTVTITTDLDRGVGLDTDMPWTVTINTDIDRGVALDTDAPWTFTIGSDLTYISELDSAMTWNFGAVTDLARGVALAADTPWAINLTTALDRGVALASDMPWNFGIATSLDRGVALASDMPWNFGIVTPQPIATYRLGNLATGPWNFGIATDLTIEGNVDLGALDMPWNFAIVTPQPSRTATFDSTMAWDLSIGTSMDRTATLVNDLPLTVLIDTILTHISTLSTDLAINIAIATQLERGVAVAADLPWAFTLTSTLGRYATLASGMSWDFALATALGRYATLESAAGPWNFDLYTELSGSFTPHYMTLLGVGE